METQSQNYASQNTAHQNMASMNAPFMILRVDVTKILDDLDLNLRNVKKGIDKEGYSVLISVGEPRANDQGIQGIMNMVSMRMNSHTIQGNFEEDHYWDYISRARKEIADTIILKCYNWGIDDTDLDALINDIMGLIEPVLTRLKKNLERISYMQQLQSRETVTQAPQKRSSLSAFSGGRE